MMELHLYHGRTEDVDMEDWGFDGPLLKGVTNFQWTYGHYYVIFGTFEECEAARKLTGWHTGVHEFSLEMLQMGDLICTQHPEGEKLYSDWNLLPAGSTEAELKRLAQHQDETE